MTQKEKDIIKKYRGLPAAQKEEVRELTAEIEILLEKDIN